MSIPQVLRRYTANKVAGVPCDVCRKPIGYGEMIFPHPFKRNPAVKSGWVPIHQTCESEFDALHGDGEETSELLQREEMNNAMLREENAALRAEVLSMRKSQEDGGRVIIIRDVDANGTVRREYKTLAHKAFDAVLYAVEQIRRANRDQRSSPYRALWIWGEHGSGKSYLCEQVADALGLRFGFESLNDQSTMSIIVGTVNPMTEVHRGTQTTDFYANGGVMVYEEGASASGNVWTMLNAAVAGRKWTHSYWGTLEKHPDFVPIFVDNTSGRGPTPAYPGRRRIDESVMSRCKVIHFPYDEALDRALALQFNPQAGAWVDWVFSVRKMLQDPQYQVKSAVYVDPRSLCMLVHDLANAPSHMSRHDMLEGAIWKDLSADIKARILAVCPLPRE